ncbi:PIG-L family deacetylase [Streptomyces rimosus]|uniref:PIG-L family deacetylase n=1 Tax=Streptomyces rimosus TaxID=1927 RepID=UPI0004CBFEE1|nr:PIG-L family deacetylase [Streptomyces rimosus]
MPDHVGAAGPFRPTRRAVALGLAALTVAGCGGRAERPRTGAAPAGKRGAVAAADDGSSGARVLQIVAHPDDDLYFMNPDLQQSIDANDQLATVYLNGGESNGRNKIPGSGTAPKADTAAYSGARRQGLRQAYALMATGRPDARWDVKVTRLPDGTSIETDTLADHPGLQLVFLGVRQHDRAGTGRSRGLPDLWADPSMITSTLVSTGSPVRDSHPVTRASLIDALVHLLEQYRPTLVRTMDPDPDMQVHDGKHRHHHDQSGYSDHPDHTAAALFTYAALARYRSRRGSSPHLVTAYRGYYNERWPDNLPKQLIKAKADVLNAYGGHPDSCGFAAGCGDYDVGQDRSYGPGWLQRTTLRHPAAGPQARPASDGRLTAFAVLGDQAAMWQETARGSGKWTAPKLLGGDGLLPGLTASLTGDGRWQLFAERIAALGPKGQDNRREIVMAQQARGGGPFGAWTSLGNPESDPDHGRRVGGPVVARADGTTYLFVRTWAKGVAVRRHTDGGWDGWTDLGGAEVQEGLSAVTDSRGRVHLFGAGHDTVHHWAQQRPGGDFTLVPTGLPAPADPPTALARPDGTVMLAYREATSVRPLVHVLPAGGGTWRDEKVGLRARGYGTLTLHPVRDGVLLAVRNNSGSTSLATLGTRKAPRWSTVDGRFVGSLCLTGSDARPVLVRMAPDATLNSAVVAG